MNILQNILVFLTFGLAISFLIKKFFYKKKSKKACGTDNCGCS
ncbi:FeoB-associated Cys-rich membrane protein [Mesoflavibacter zeaxanthinifaciens subsp. sabulilitoris]|uniref:FeoB-associated Cys-rich membrane protein n=1 Tax=Mesoflavibacter zeaxanthinifaciens subsp. sabulilitoris TaxID=1520893 RepID=A0A2T1N6J0_9FLAO|nr:FeoB-associated Cys-rich membrane protein [Mesoflavibacter zeaxanthinifaciens]PSG87090.1 FeoB-associated Cys-rich membrane protein [Mesoflavibacter zeaxanthinifaciens subsp. sabulilitoris]